MGEAAIATDMLKKASIAARSLPAQPRLHAMNDDFLNLIRLSAISKRTKLNANFGLVRCRKAFLAPLHHMHVTQ
jgi:hypothetical protein